VVGAIRSWFAQAFSPVSDLRASLFVMPKPETGLMGIYLWRPLETN
jgi:hypothetical protein